ncbi:hypothetical protein BgiBS90_031464, partial [Biomphalaria glabrata]
MPLWSRCGSTEVANDTPVEESQPQGDDVGGFHGLFRNVAHLFSDTVFGYFRSPEKAAKPPEHPEEMTSHDSEVSGLIRPNAEVPIDSTVSDVGQGQSPHTEDIRAIPICVQSIREEAE